VSGWHGVLDSAAGDRIARHPLTSGEGGTTRAIVRAWMVGAAVVVLALGLGTTAAQAAPFVYVTNGLRGNVAQFDVGAGGALSPKSPAAVPVGGIPQALAVSPLPRVPTSKNQCKNSGWRSFAQFRNQGQCVAFVNTSRPASHRPGP
jgi:hypothetical protein